MFEAGLNIVLGTDDPAMFATTMGHCWRTLFAASKWHVTEQDMRRARPNRGFFVSTTSQSALAAAI
jgi:adenosine deaminase